jgi:hypothetical protein
LHINPERPVDEPSRQMILGSAVHCSVFEPFKFTARYAEDFVAPEGCLDTIQDLRNWLEAQGVKAKGTTKGPIIQQVLAIDPNCQVLSVLQAAHATQHQGKVILSSDEIVRLSGMADALAIEPAVQRYLQADGQIEVPMFATDPDTGVSLKAKMDLVLPAATVDLKTFTQKRGKSIDKTIADTIWYEKYHWQAYFYAMIRRLQAGESRENASLDHVNIFVESDPPHEVRIRVLRPVTAGEVNLYWERARLETRDLIRLYADCMNTFGFDKPWRVEQKPDPLLDADLSALPWS